MNMGPLFLLAIGFSDKLPAKKVIDLLDKHYQAVFADLSLTVPSKYEETIPGKPPKVIIRKEMFGSNRMARVRLLEGGHGLLNVVIGHEATRRQASDALTGWREWIYLVGNKTGPVKPELMNVSKSMGWGQILKGVPSKQYPTSEQAIDLAKIVVTKKKAVVKTEGDWFVAAKPIIFTDKQCLNCHQNAKLGGYAGVMVYKLHADPTRKAERMSKIRK